MSGSISAGCRVVVDSLLHSHATTRAARHLVGQLGSVIRLVPRGTSTYALVEMDEEVRGFPFQRRWSVHVDDLYLVSSPVPSVAEPVYYTVGFEPYPAELKALKGVRHAVPTLRAERSSTEALCGITVCPVDSALGAFAFDPTSKLACSGCVTGLRVRHPNQVIDAAKIS